MTVENDIVLIYFEDQPLIFARIEEISADVKKNWYHVRLLLLQIPLQTVTWILKDIYIQGQEFTMGGKRMRLEKVIAPKGESLPSMGDGKKEIKIKTTAPVKSKIIPLSGRKPKT